jgi:hypothetical protein
VRITTRRPKEVAREVAQLLLLGQRTFVIRRIDHGGMLDLERLGAARYAAGLQSTVELEEETPASVAASR